MPTTNVAWRFFMSSKAFQQRLSAYAIHYLPTKFLIDKDGRMIGKFSDEELDAKLKEIFGF